MSKQQYLNIDNNELMGYVSNNIVKPEFAYFLNSCMDKWRGVKEECDIMDIIMNGIATHYNITIDELIYGKKMTTPRSLMFYLMKKGVKKISFEALGDIFARQKSYVFKSYDEAKFMVERHKRKEPILVVSTIKKNLALKNLLSDTFDID